MFFLFTQLRTLKYLCQKYEIKGSRHFLSRREVSQSSTIGSVASHQDKPGTHTDNRKQKPTRWIHNRQAGNCVGQASFIFTTHGLSTDEICDYIR